MAAGAVIGFTICCVLFQIGLNFANQDKSQVDTYDQIPRKTLEILPQNSILLVSGDHLAGSLLYQQLVQGVRTDVVVLDQGILSRKWAKHRLNKNYPRIIFPKNGVYLSTDYNMKDFLQANLPYAPVFTWGGVASWDNSWVQDYKNHVYGLVLRMIPKDAQFDVDAWSVMNREYFASIETRFLLNSSRGTWEFPLLRQYWGGQRNFNVEKMQLALTNEKYLGWFLQGFDKFDELLSRQIQPDPLIFKFRGLAYSVLLTQFPEAKGKMVADLQKYLELRDEPDIEIGKIEDLLQKNGIDPNLKIRK